MAKLVFGEENVMSISFHAPLRATEIPLTSALESAPNNERSINIEPKTNLLSASEENNDFSKIEFPKLMNHNTYGTSPKIINMCIQCLNKILNRMAWDSYLATVGSYLPRRHTSSATIKVQPTTISRRTTLIQGTKCFTGRRPSKDSSKRTKIKRPKICTLMLTIMSQTQQDIDLYCPTSY
ncbi:unnamed protein product [Psylliodes chrysocephalus]|uniref:Uncharacterized protein n=1 Tax=Psylliodes chrysocephalus TaxID=3402493 RepID=A0A9P0GHB1_9CUCU|nr:unnamed protein product [Psylliodes chrysocephala]